MFAYSIFTTRNAANSEKQEKFKSYWQGVEPESLRVSSPDCIYENLKYRNKKHVRAQIKAAAELKICDFTPRL